MYDAGRYDQKEIRMCIVTEEDIKAGKPVGETSRLRMRVSELGGYLNYVDTEEDYERYITVLPGTEKSAILEQLPETVTLIGEDGSALELTGEWNCLDYSKKHGRRVHLYFLQRSYGQDAGSLQPSQSVRYGRRREGRRI